MPRSSCTRISAVTLALLIGCHMAHSQTPPASEPATQPASQLKLVTERLVIFKDGHGLVIKDGRGVADADGRAFITEVPDAAVLGCFWASSGEKILSMRAEWIEKTETRSGEIACLTMAQLLRANVDRTVAMELVDRMENGVSVQITGKIIDVLDVPPDDDQLWTRRGGAQRRPRAAAASAFYTSLTQGRVTQNGQFTPESFAGEGTLVRELVPRGGEFVLIEDAEHQRKVLPVARVQAIRGDAGIVTTTTQQQEIFTRGKRLSFDFGKASAGKEVSLKLFYFTAGLRWIPTYRVTGELKEKADLALQGEIVNDVTDVEHAALDLVVGVPNFRFDNTVSPLTLEQTMRGMAAIMENNGYAQNMLNSQFDNRARVGSAVPQPDPAMTIAPELRNAAGEQDLFVYSIADFSLRKGARATVPLWQQQADLKHVYTFEVSTRRTRAGFQCLTDATPPGEQNSNDPTGRAPNRIVFNQVWHQLQLTNGGKLPWTTGAALMMRGFIPLGQDLLTYTPPTGKALLPVTIAVDVRGTVDEQEIGRQTNAMRFDNNEYMQVTKKGTITITSYRAEKSDMRISLSTGGKVTSASDDGKIKLNDFRPADWEESNYMRVNAHSDVTWDFSIEPGTTKTITYEMTIFTR